MKKTVRDYQPLLEQAIAEAKAAGIEPEASELERACFAVFTTSSELLQEQGVAMARFLKETRGRLPREVERKMRVCLNETWLVWPGWRRLVALWRRREPLG
jgi:hypothetical protein